MKIIIKADGQKVAEFYFYRDVSEDFIGRWAHDEWPDAEKVTVEKITTK